LGHNIKAVKAGTRKAFGRVDYLLVGGAPYIQKGCCLFYVSVLAFFTPTSDLRAS
jgi:hypothetical protein